VYWIDTDTWDTDYDEGWAKTANGEDLENGKRYLVIRYGKGEDGKYTFITGASRPILGCGLDYDGSGKLEVDVTSLVISGGGLSVDSFGIV